MTTVSTAISIAMLVPAQVALRSGGRLDMKPTVIDARAVTFDKKPAMTGVLGNSVGWDRVRTVEGELSASAGPWMKTADKAWRARTRLERADAAGAEPLFEELFSEYGARTGPTAAMIDEGLLVCRLYRGAQLTAIQPWVCWLRCGTQEDPLPSMIDLGRATGPGLFGIAVNPSRATGLIPQLPPVFIDTPALQAFARAEPELSLAADEKPGPLEGRAGALWQWYRFAARAECGLESVQPAPATDDAVLLVSQIVLARAGDAPLREKSRLALQDRLKNAHEPWMEAWCRAAIGRSLVRSDLPEDKLQGVLELLHVPARFADQSSYLTGLALAEACVALKELGDMPGADRLRAELFERFAGHPATDWSPVRAWPVPAQIQKKTEKEGT